MINSQRTEIVTLWPDSSDGYALRVTTCGDLPVKLRLGFEMHIDAESIQREPEYFDAEFAKADTAIELLEAAIALIKKAKADAGR